MEKNTRRSVVERFDDLLIGSIRLALVLLMTAFFAWAALLLLFQAIGWLKSGVWQPVPVAAVFLSLAGQDSSIRVAGGSSLPLELVPSLAAFSVPSEAAQHVAGRMVGLGQVVVWLLDLSMSLCLCLLAMLAGSLSGAIEPLPGA